MGVVAGGEGAGGRGAIISQPLSLLREQDDEIRISTVHRDGYVVPDQRIIFEMILQRRPNRRSPYLGRGRCSGFFDTGDRMNARQHTAVFATLRAVRKGFLTDILTIITRRWRINNKDITMKIFSISPRNTLKFTAMAASIALSSLHAHAALYDRGNGMIYDSTLDITWLQDANYAQTSGYDTDGYMNWQQAVTWADTLVYGGFSDWRLPSARLIGQDDHSFDGSTDLGANNTRSELGHLFHELGNQAAYTPAGVPVMSGLGWLNSTFTDADTGLPVSFLHVQNGMYWAAEEYSSPDEAWYYYAEFGLQNYSYKTAQYSAWAVRTGDVAAVPVPAAAWMLGSALVGLLGVKRRYSR